MGAASSGGGLARGGALREALWSGSRGAAEPPEGPSGPAERKTEWRSAASWPPVMGTVAGLVGLIAASFALRFGDLGTSLWIDEGISVGVASHRLAEIPGLLRQDGSPPLYYLLLHGWMALFGTSETATHALSLTIALATVPVALWAGWSLFGRRVGWTFAALVSVSPYLAFFATETRMYALLALLALVATASFLHAFAFGRRRYLAPFAVALALALYTHSWGLWLVVGLATALIPCAVVAADRRRLLRDAALGFGAAGLAYLPWLPTLLYQRAHTGAPWSTRPLPREAVTVVALLLGDNRERVLVALLLVAGPALWVLVRRDGRLRPPLLAVGLIAAVPVVVGWLAAQVSPSWAPRYLAVCAPAVLLVAALGLARAGTRGLVALALILTLWVQPLARVSGLRSVDHLDDKPQVTPLVQAIGSGLAAGDLVVAMQMEEVPVLAYYLPSGLRYATAMGPVADPGVADWRDALARITAATPQTSLRPALDATPVGAKVLLVCAQPWTGPTPVPWFTQMELRCGEWRGALQADARFAPAPVVSGAAVPEPAPDGSSTVAGRQVLAVTRIAS